MSDNETIRLSFVVTMNVEPHPEHTPEESANQMAEFFEDYLTYEHGNFMEDYGKGAWGGYEGPFVDNVKVTRI